MKKLGKFIGWLRYGTTFIERIAIFGFISAVTWFALSGELLSKNYRQQYADDGYTIIARDTYYEYHLDMFFLGLIIEFVLLFIIFGGKK